MIIITTERLEGEFCGVLTVNEKKVTFKDYKIYGVPDGDLTSAEDKATRRHLKGLERKYK